MEQLTPEEQRREADAIEQAALATEGVDRFCSGPDWGNAAHEAWDAELEARVWRGSGGYVSLLPESVDGHIILSPFDRMWGYSCPLIGADSATLADEFADVLLSDSANWDLALLTGLKESSPLWNALVRVLYREWTLGIGQPQQRWCASLEGGIDAYLGRRSAKLRRELLRQERRAHESGVRFERGAGTAEELFRRVLGVEDRSWKATKQTGLHLDDMRSFYRVLVPRLHARNRLRILFARIDDTDVGYILGGVAGDLYRGLQFSFDNDYRKLGLGNLLQLTELRSLCDEGFVTYDLGIDIDYKARWADERVETATLVIRN